VLFFRVGLKLWPNPDPDVPPLHEPLAQLERHLIDDYLRALRYDPEALRQRPDPAARTLMAAASQHAALRPTEVESRAHYIRELHDGRS
jgi:hypothetical protein